MTKKSSNIIKAANIGPAVGHPRNITRSGDGPDQGTESGGKTEVEIHRDGETIKAIEIACGCGRTTFIECVYEEESAKS